MHNLSGLKPDVKHAAVSADRHFSLDTLSQNLDQLGLVSDVGYKSGGVREIF